MNTSNEFNPLREYESNEIPGAMAELKNGEYREIIEISGKKRIIHKIYKSVIGVYYRKVEILKRCK